MSAIDWKSQYASGWASPGGEQSENQGLSGYVPVAENLGGGFQGVHSSRYNLGRPSQQRDPLVGYQAPSGFVPEEFITEDWYSCAEEIEPPVTYRMTDYPDQEWGSSFDRSGPSPIGYPEPGDGGSEEFRGRKVGPIPQGPGTAYGPPPGAAGGFDGKRSETERHVSTTSAESQIFLNTSDVQWQKEFAQGPRSTLDEPRSAIGQRIVGPRTPRWAKDFEQGGGPGTPSMLPVSQDRIPKRPFFSRRTRVPGVLNTGQYTEMTQYDAIGWVPAIDTGTQVVDNTQDPPYSASPEEETDTWGAGAYLG